MYEHKVVEVKLSAFKLSPEEDYQSVVDSHEKEGWELMRIDSGISGYGIPALFKVIFKRKKEKMEKDIG